MKNKDFANCSARTVVAWYDALGSFRDYYIEKIKKDKNFYEFMGERYVSYDNKELMELDEWKRSAECLHKILKDMKKIYDDAVFEIENEAEVTKHDDNNVASEGIIN